MASAAALAFFWAAPACHGHGVVGSIGVSCWKPTSTTPAGCTTGVGGRTKFLRTRRRPTSSWLRAGPWLAPPSPPMRTPGDDECRPCVRRRAQRSKPWRPFGGVPLLRTTVARAPSAGATAAATAAAGARYPTGENIAKHMGVLLLPPLGWFPAAVSGVLRWRPVECTAAPAVVAEPVVAAGRSAWDRLSVLQVSCARVSDTPILSVPFA